MRLVFAAVLMLLLWVSTANAQSAALEYLERYPIDGTRTVVKYPATPGGGGGSPTADTFMSISEGIELARELNADYCMYGRSVRGTRWVCGEGDAQFSYEHVLRPFSVPITITGYSCYIHSGPSTWNATTTIVLDLREVDAVGGTNTIANNFVTIPQTQADRTFITGTLNATTTFASGTLVLSKDHVASNMAGTNPGLAFHTCWFTTE